MKKDEAIKILINFGYKKDTANRMVKNKARPTILKAIELQEKYNIPCTSWKDFKSFLDDSKECDNIQD